MKRETQCKLYQSLVITGVLLLVVKGFAFNCPLFSLGEPVDIELNTPAIEEEFDKLIELRYEIPPPERIWCEEENKWKWVSRA